MIAEGRKMIEQIQAYVKEAFGKADIERYGEAYFHEHHIMPAYAIAMELAKKYEADEEIVGISVLLHDIGLIGRPEGRGHDVFGAEKAAGILKEMGLSEDTIERVTHCIRYHDAHDGDPESVEGKVVCTADALSHIMTPWFIVKSRYSDRPMDAYLVWCRKKLEKDFNRLQFEDERERARPTYECWKRVLDGMGHDGCSGLKGL